MVYFLPHLQVSVYIHPTTTSISRNFKIILPVSDLIEILRFDTVVCGNAIKLSFENFFSLLPMQLHVNCLGLQLFSLLKPILSI